MQGHILSIVGDALTYMHWSNPSDSTGSPAWTLKFTQLSRALKVLSNSLINTVKSYLSTSPLFWLGRWFDWSKWVAVSSSLPPDCNPNFSFMDGVGKKWVTKTWMWEIFLQGHILGIGGDALRFDSHLLAIPISVLWMGLGKKWVTKTWMWETYLSQGHILSSIGGDALRFDG